MLNALGGDVAIGQLLYISDAVGTICREDLAAIAAAAQRYNAERGITGLLFYSAGHFVQYLEGDPVEVRKLFEMISKDPRHTSIKLLYERPVLERLFDDWDMAVLDLEAYTDAERLDLQDLIHLAGYEAQGDETPADLQILRKFRRLLVA